MSEVDEPPVQEQDQDIVDEQGTTEEKTEEPKSSPRSKKPTTRLSSLLRTRKRKVIAISATLLLVIVILLAIPVTRYGTTSWLIKKQVSFTIISSEDGTPVSNAKVTIGSVHGTTNEKGKVTLSSPVGPHDVTVEKKYYKELTSTYTVPLFMSPEARRLTLKTNGRQISFAVTDTLTGKPLAGVALSALGASATSNTKGLATLVVPVATRSLSVSLSAEGYNTFTKDLTLSETDQYATTITPSGYVYFLSKASGTIDVKKSHLDGSDVRTVLTGTGTEGDYLTSLLSSRDWAYSALLTNRDGKEGVFLINSKNDTMTTIDTGDAGFTAVGWNGHKFYFIVYRNNIQYYQANRVAIKVYDADKDTLTTIDQNGGITLGDTAPQYQVFSNVYILENEIVYGRYWESYYGGSTVEQGKGRVPELISVNTATNKSTLIKAFPDAPTSSSLQLSLYESQGIYVRYSLDSNLTFYEYESGKLTAKSSLTDDDFFKAYPAYLVSPSGTSIFWYEPRDGKNYLFASKINGEDKRELTISSDFKTYGWYSDQFILLSKNDSQLYIAPVNDVKKVTKITDFHKAQSVGGYGYGYGGVY